MPLNTECSEYICVFRVFANCSCWQMNRNGELTFGRRHRYRLQPAEAFREFIPGGRSMKDKDNKEAVVTPIKGILTAVLRQCRRDLQVDPDLLGLIWNRAAGANIAKNAQPAAFKQRLLIVHVSSSVWLQELYFQKAALIERVNLEAGQTILEDIQFKVGPLVAP